VIPHSWLGLSKASRKLDVDPAFGEAAQVDEDRELSNRVFLFGRYQLIWPCACSNALADTNPFGGRKRTFDNATFAARRNARSMEFAERTTNRILTTAIR
jgi:hypothetical protein